ncbi:hypothetical protein F971_01123 [Acinetobacter vivianii]|uniref:Bacteriophage abortive infection AbiH n=1 Tax=Acinetobacter vivianii TaxID=1776742 RepID=N8W894_9GAMM|nr:AbiH family protein [Acinetobacter vivianii]ENU93083.1 hypothetical protein F971_01123 [Acinetobacter vivianii]
MNILIVGNGFDLSHYLPTKYDHFMVAMEAIEGWDEQKGEMGFDDLFGSLYEKENYFFKYTKAMYQTDEVKISIDQIIELKQHLKENVWYQYFSDHVRQVKTWIDFETKIKEALSSICKFLSKIEECFDNLGECNFPIYLLEKDQKKNIGEYYISLVDSQNFSTLKLMKKNLNYGNALDFWIDYKIGEIDQNWFFSSEKSEYGISSEKYISYLNQQLEIFITIFNFYLEVLVKSLKPQIKLKISTIELKELDKVYSFNYTNSYSRFYETEKKIEFLHGCTGEKQNIVLGISDLHNDYLRKIKAYGFTKYHQKLLKNTDYKFLKGGDEIHGIVSFWQRINQKKLAITLAEKEKNSLNILIWGHSLDISDEVYINEIFSLNDKNYFDVHVVIYYFNNQAKFDLLANLLHILGKEKVELWMKNGRLKFELNPNVVEINNIQPVNLPKFG